MQEIQHVRTFRHFTVCLFKIFLKKEICISFPYFITTLNFELVQYCLCNQKADFGLCFSLFTVPTTAGTGMQYWISLLLRAEASVRENEGGGPLAWWFLCSSLDRAVRVRVLVGILCSMRSCVLYNASLYLGAEGNPVMVYIVFHTWEGGWGEKKI